MKQVKGKAHNIDRVLFGRYTLSNTPWSNDIALYCTQKPILTKGIIAYIVPEGHVFKTAKPIVEVEKLPDFRNGDIIRIDPQGAITVVWEEESRHNAFYVTDMCNSKCIMCPQSIGFLSRYDECLAILRLISFKGIDSLGVTGGEPTLDIVRLVEFLEKLAEKSPGQQVHILTNGRNFKRINYASKLAGIRNINLSFGIPLYSAVAEKHDYIVGVNGAFGETIEGIYNLAKFNFPVEIRTVILKQNYKELNILANYIYRNMPFVFHVALMGMEYCGNAEINYNLLAIDPATYKTELYEAVKEFVRYNMLVSVYNTPLCLADSRVRKFCVDSISTWKKTYLPECDKCTRKNECCGVFETSFKHSENIHCI